MTTAALSVRELSVALPVPNGTAQVVDRVSLDLFPGEMMGLVGESGCGKSVMAMALMGLLEGSGASVTATGLSLAGEDMPGPAANGFRTERGRNIAMIFQEPATALDPVFTIGWQIAAVLRRQRKLSRADARAAARTALGEVGFPNPDEVCDAYPGQLSGGMRQLAMIAMAMALRPRVLIADEPTTALDVTTQQLVIDRLQRLRDEAGTAVLFITHDLGVVARCCARILVMYCGRIVEQAPYPAFYAHPRHPYSAGLLAAVPRLAPHRHMARGIAGQVPAPDRLPPGCHFAPRCEHATAQCSEQVPSLTLLEDSRVACHHPQ